MDYAIEVFWSDEDDAYVAVVPDLPGCSAIGDTAEDAAHEIQTVKGLYLDALRAEGRPVPPPTRHATLRR